MHVCIDGLFITEYDGLRLNQYEQGNCETNLAIIITSCYKEFVQSSASSPLKVSYTLPTTYNLTDVLLPKGIGFHRAYKSKKWSSDNN